MKKCSNCFKIKEYVEFYTRKQGDGYQSRCKACNWEVVKGYQERKRENMTYSDELYLEAKGEK